MKLLIPLDTLKSYKPQDRLPCECLHCRKTFLALKPKILRALRGEQPCNFCGTKCSYAHGWIAKNPRKLRKPNKPRSGPNRINPNRKSVKVKTKCSQCSKEFERYACLIKGERAFCSQSCSTTYNNQHKTFSKIRSKLEIWMESQFKSIYPSLEILYNNRTIIGSELDIYIPSIKFAVELNGIVHYEPIYGNDKLAKIQNRDKIKMQLCLERGIELATIDVSSMKNFKEDKAKKFLNIILEIINSKS